MKINDKDLALIGKSKDNLRDALGAGLDAISDMTVERLTGGDAEDARSIVAEVGKLNTLLAAVVVWNVIYTSTEDVLNSPQQPTMQQVIDLVDKEFTAVLDSTLLQKAKPEFYPYLIVAYGVAIKHLRFIDSAGTFAESVADEIDADNDWTPGQALYAMKDNDPDIIEQAKEVAARRAVREIASRGFTPEQIVAVRKVATGLGIDADKIGLPPVEEAETDNNVLREGLAQISLRHGIKLDVSHLKQTEPGKFIIHVGPDGESMSADDAAKFLDLRAAELDGGCDNLPRASEERSVPRYPTSNNDNADGVDQRILVVNSPNAEDLRRSMRDFLDTHTTSRFPAEARNFGRRPAA